MVLRRTSPSSRAIPKMAMNPMEAGTLMYWPEMRRAAKPPVRARGMLMRMTPASTTDPKMA